MPDSLADNMPDRTSEYYMSDRMPDNMTAYVSW